MPYIPQVDREKVLERVKNGNWDVLTPGEKCFVYYMRLKEEWMKDQSWTGWIIAIKKVSATSITCYTNGQLVNPVFTLELQEAIYYFRKDFIDPYEEEKKRINGAI